MEPSIVLFVDDEEKVLSALRRAMEGEEALVCRFAGGGEEALRILHETPCKVVMSDVKMPGMHGLELLGRVKQLYPNIVRAVLSGHADIKLVLDAVNQGGIDRYLTKPWEDDEVAATLRQCIELFDLRQERDMLKEELAALREKGA